VEFLSPALHLFTEAAVPSARLASAVPSARATNKVNGIAVDTASSKTRPKNMNMTVLALFTRE